MSTKPVVFLAFANSPDEPLDRLNEEEDLVRNILHDRQIKQNHFHVHHESHADLNNIRTYLRKFEHNIWFFHYAGHANSKQVFLRSGEAEASGLADMLAEQDKLKLVFLNGCSSAGQIAYLLERGIPAVIGTRAPIDDLIARDFSKHFYESLEMGATIEKAFNQAAAFAKGAGKNTGEVRSIDWEQAEGEEDDLWTLVHHPDKAYILKEKLPGERKIEVDENYIPSVGLINSLSQKLAEGNLITIPVEDEWDDDDSEGLDRELVSQVLKVLPTAIAENLRNLVLLSDIDLDRLNQLVKSYEELMELVVAISLAQIWDIKLKVPALEIGESAVEEVKKFIEMNGEERATFRFAPLLLQLQHILAGYQEEVLVKELLELKKWLSEGNEFKRGCKYFDQLRDQLQEGSVDKEEYYAKCRRAEEALTTLLCALADLARYKMITIKDVSVIKFRHHLEATFEHQVIQRSLELSNKAGKLRKKSLNKVLDNQSVMLWKFGPDKSITGSLSLSPFIFDKNPFDKASDISQLFFFHHFDPHSSRWHYQGVHDLEKTELLEVSKNSYHLIEEQLQAFKVAFLHG